MFAPKLAQNVLYQLNHSPGQWTGGAGSGPRLGHEDTDHPSDDSKQVSHLFMHLRLGRLGFEVVCHPNYRAGNNGWYVVW